MCSVLAPTWTVKSFLVSCNSKLSVQGLISFKLEVFFYHYLDSHDVELVIVDNQDSWPAVTRLAIVLARLPWRGLCLLDWLFHFDLGGRLEIERDVGKTFRIVNINFFNGWLYRSFFKFLFFVLTYDVEQLLINQTHLLLFCHLWFDPLGLAEFKANWVFFLDLA